MASLERVQFDGVLKDFTKTSFHINTIPSVRLDDVKN